MAELDNYGHSNRWWDHEIYKQWVQEEDTEQLKATGVKLVWNVLWTLRDISPANLIWPDLLHNMFLRIVQYLIDWIEGFLTVHNQLNAFDNIWTQIPAYSGNHVPQKTYRSLSQVQEKEMRAILRVLLAIFTAAFRWKTNILQVTCGQQQEFKKATLCVRYITDFGLIARYHSYADSTMKYMRTYLQKFHETKDVFLRYRRGTTARKAQDISKQFTEEIDHRWAADIGLPVAQCARLVEDDPVERAYRINQALEEDSHFNFLKLHLLSHYANQIAQYGSLLQYSIEICEASHNPLKDAYYPSNHIDSLPQMIDSYTREHNFVVQKMNMELWARKDPELNDVLEDVIRQHYNTGQFRCGKKEPVWMRLQGTYASNTIYRLTHVSVEFDFSELVNDVIEFFAENEY